MKKRTKMIGAALLATSLLGAVACGGSGDELAIGKEFIAADTQLDALVKLDTGYADVAVIDSVMAGYYMNDSGSTYASKMQVVDGLVLATESYGIAAKKGNGALASKINEGLLLTYQTGVYANIAETFGVTSSMALTGNEVDEYAGATDASWANVVSSGKLVIGYTIFAPIAYEPISGAGLTGFDIELAKAVVAALNLKYETNVEAEFVLIDWDTKEAKLQDETLDLVWNGLTITEERQEAMTITMPYLYNKQVAIVLNEDADKYTDVDSMKDAIMTAESGSAGESVIKG